MVSLVFRRLMASVIVVFGAVACENGSLISSESAFESTGNRSALLGSSAPETRIAYYEGLVRKNSSDAKALRGLGREYAAQKLWNQSAGAYREALILDTGDRDAQLGYARAQLGLKRYGDASAHAQKALAVRRDVDALLMAGVSLDGLGQGDAARALYQEAIKINPRDLDSRSNIALSMALAGQPDAYATMRAVAFAPDADGRHQRNLVLVAAMTGDPSRARADGREFGLGDKEIDAIIAIAARARSGGAAELGLAART